MSKNTFGNGVNTARRCKLEWMSKGKKMLVGKGVNTPIICYLESFYGLM